MDAPHCVRPATLRRLDSALFNVGRSQGDGCLVSQKGGTMKCFLTSFVLVVVLVQPARAGLLGTPVSVRVRSVNFYLGPEGGWDSSQSLAYVNPTSSMRVDNFKDDRVPYGFLHDLAADFSLSSISTGTTVTLRLLVHEALVNETTSLPFPVPLDVRVFGGSGVVSLADFPPPGSTWGQYSIPPGDHSQSPYVLDIYLTIYVQYLISNGYQYAGVYLGTGHENHSFGPPRLLSLSFRNPRVSLYP